MSAPLAPLLPWESQDPARAGRVLAVHAHPDDETIATGLALAHHVARGDEVHVVTCTLGEEGEVIPADLAWLEGNPALAEHRDGEVSAAMAELGVQHHYLGDRWPRWRDSGMAGTSSAEHPRAFIGADLDAAAHELQRVLDQVRPDIVLTYDEHGGYGHPDHIQAHRLTMRALALLPASQRPVVYAAVTPERWARQDRLWVQANVQAHHHAAPVAHVMPEVIIPERDDSYPPSVVADGDVTHAVGGEAEALPEAVISTRDRALRRHRTQVVVGPGWFALSNRRAARLPAREGYCVLDPATGQPIRSQAGGT